MMYDLDNIDIKPAIKSDHSIISLSFKIKNTYTRGKGFWKFNSSLLRDKEYVQKINTCLTDCKEKYKEEVNKPLIWDTIKCELRTETISYATFKAKQKRILESDIIQRMEYLDYLINQNELQYLEEYNSLKKDLEDLQYERAKGSMIRSRAEIVDNDEKCSKYFLNLEKRNYKIKYIKSIINDDNEEINNPDNVLKEEESFYKNDMEKRTIQRLSILWMIVTLCNFVNKLMKKVRINVIIY